MTTPSLILIIHRPRVILRHIIVYPQPGLLLVRPELTVQTVRDHLVCAVLEGQKLPVVVVPQAQVACDDDAATDGVEDLLENGIGIHVGGLDEYGALGMLDGGEEGDVLGGVGACVV